MGSVMSKLAKYAAPALVGLALVGCAIGCYPEASSAASSASSATATQSSGKAKAAAEKIDFSEKTDCSTCHKVEVKSMTDDKCLAGLAPHASIDCLTCHEYNSSLEKAHAKVSPGDKPRKYLKRTKVEESACVTCHDAEKLIEQTESVTALTDTEGTTVNPHEVAAIGTGHDDITCSSCHKMHVSEGADETGGKLCLSCHHTEVYECGTCH